MEYEAKTSPKFNVYRILRLERKEVLVHTPMLAELLNPVGAHGQGFLFLKSFLQILEGCGLNPPAREPEQYRWFVEIQKPIGSHGNLDVLITCPELGYAVAIENKIGAGEQPDQLWRYWSWLRKHERRFPRQHLIFLTPEGRQAATARRAVYATLSYHTDIQSWLTDTLPQVKSSAVRETVNQYLQIIKNC